MTIFAEISPNPFRHGVICSPPNDSGHLKQHFEYTFDITLHSLTYFPDFHLVYPKKLQKKCLKMAVYFKTSS